MSWTWDVSKDNNTGSIYWTDRKKCQGVWNLISMENGKVVYLNAKALALAGLILILM